MKKPLPLNFTPYSNKGTMTQEIMNQRDASARIKGELFGLACF